MIFDFSTTTRYYIYGESVDMRKGIPTLYNLVKTGCALSALSGDAYVFISSSCKSIKILRWDKDGFILYHKRLDLGLFVLPKRVSSTPFFELKSDDFNNMVCRVKYRSIGNELRCKAMLTL